MKTAGIVLIVIGILGFAVTGISFTTGEEVIDIGPLEVVREKERTIPFTPLAAGGAVVIGIGLLVADRRRAA